jgi:putative ABC transport system permease protein
MIRRLLAWLGWRHTRRAPGLFLLAVLGVALGVAVFVAIQVANRTVLRTFAATVDAVAGRANLEIAAGSGGLPDSLFLRVRRTPGIAAATPIVTGSGLLPEHPGEVVEILGIDSFSNAPFRSYEFGGGAGGAGGAGGDPGEFLRWLADSRGALLPAAFARKLGVAAGDSLVVLARSQPDTLVVRGLLRFTGEFERTAERLVLLDIATAQEVTGRPGRLDRIDLIVDDPEEEAARLARAVGSALPPDATVRRPGARSAQVETMFAAFRLNLTALSLISLFVGVFLVYNAAMTEVVRRRREIGILRALGAPRRLIGRLVLLETGVLGVIGIAAGLVLGVVLARFVLGSIARTVSALYVQVAVRELFVEPRVLVAAALAGAGVVVAAGIAPAREAARLEPQVVLAEGRYPAPRWFRPLRILALALLAGALAAAISISPLAGRHPWTGFVAALLILVAGALAAPAAAAALIALAAPLVPASVGLRLAARELRAALRRAAVTIAALSSAIAMVVGVTIMIESFRRTVDLWIEQTIRADLYITPASHAAGEAVALPPDVIAAIAGRPDLRAVDRLRSFDLTVGGRNVRGGAVLLDVIAAESTFLFRKGDARAVFDAAVRDGGVIVSEPLARHARLAEGDTLRLVTPSGPAALPIAGVFYDYSSDAGLVLFHLPHYARLYRDDQVNSLALYLADPAATESVRDAILETAGREHALLVRSNRDIRTAALREFDQTFAITMTLKLITLIVAMTGVFFTLTVSVAARRAEIGILRAIGATAAQVRRMVLGEALLIGLAALLVGAVTGIGLALLLVFVINRQFFGWTILWVLTPRVLIEALAVVAAASLLAAWLPARAAMRADPAASLRAE